jgi:hypothetical protein
VAGKSGISQGSNDSSTSEYRTCSSRQQEKGTRDPSGKSEGPASPVMKRVKSLWYGACPIGIRRTEQRSAAPNTHYFSSSPIACECPRRVSPNRVRHERVSSYGAQPVPIVTCARAVWATGSPWYGQSTEGLVVQLDVLHSRAIDIGLFPRKRTMRRKHERKCVKPCEIRERGTQRDRG